MLFRYIPAALMAAIIPALSLLPAAFFRGVPRAARFAGADKIIHALMYAAFALTLHYALAPDRRPTVRAALVIAISASLYGLALEIAQSALTTSRAMDPLDALANAAGAFATALLARAWAKHRAPNHQSPIANR